jgi:DNA polymerase I
MGHAAASSLRLFYKQHLYLVDGSAYIFRAYHRLPPLTNPRRARRWARSMAITTMLWKLAEDLNKADGPTHLAVILDASGKSFRNDIYDDYKANRPPPPEDLVPQFPLIRDATRAFSLPCIEEAGAGGGRPDRILCPRAAARGWDVTIVSSDKDLMQLIGPSTPGRADRHARHDEEPAHRHSRSRGEVRGRAGSGRRCAGADGRRGGQCAGHSRDRPQDRDQADPGTRRLEAALMPREGDEAVQAAREPDRAGRHGRLSRVLVTLKEDCDLPGRSRT